ncbi:MAG TPA: cytochrome-c peroxidase, partial [Gemmatimonadaceae bacterium]|nr:cytochrome-c peroxidase [Gemmatimonadaceae bacterium]
MFRRFVVAVLAATVVACSDRITPVSPALRPGESHADLAPSSTAQLVRQLAASRGIIALPKAPRIRPELVHLGQALAFDKILSGNHDISCMTCHLPAFATGDGKSLAVGQGGTGLGPSREHPNGVFIPRNGPPLFNLNSMLHLFWDGRVSVDAAGNF